MASARIVATWPLTPHAVERLREVAGTIEDVSGDNLPKEQLAKRLEDADAIVTFPLAIRFDRDLLAHCKNLKVIATVSVGYDNIDLGVCAERGVKVGNTPGVIAPATADIGMALILATMRRILAGVDFVRAGKFERGEMAPYGNDLNRKTLGIFGMGAIGAALGQRARASGMKIIYYNRRKRSDVDPTEAAYVSFGDLLAKSDVIAVTAPLTPETRGVFGKEAFAKMKRGSYFVNIARGGLVQTDALCEALKSGQLAYAGLDVTDPEPLTLSHPLYSLENVVIIPHIGTSTPETRDEMLELAVSNVIAALRDQPLPAPVPLPVPT
ncbi:MAG TPA: D-glycerate dehydrogenase [Candidatus Baltobacteraceae bacterium]|jgi:glyoxylate reductase